MSTRNIKLAYIANFFWTPYFWYGIWIFYYLRFTDYAGIGLVESLHILSQTIFEIPTGAIGDLLGKKKTLIIAYTTVVIGNLVMGFASSFAHLLVAVVILDVAYAFYSGTMEAFIYDSLKEEKKENYFDKVLAKKKSIELIAIATASIMGGVLYKISPGLPFIALAISQIIGLLIVFFFREPSVDTDVFSLNNFINQHKKGFQELFKSPKIKSQSLLILFIGIFMVILYEVLNDIIFVEIGFTEKQLGTVIAIAMLIGSQAVRLYPKIIKKIGRFKFLYSSIIVYALFLFSTPFLYSFTRILFLIGVSLCLRAYEMTSSVIINKNTASKYRATTLSTLNMMRSMPYVVFAYLIGSMMDLWSGKIIGMVIGGILVMILIINTIFSHQSKKIL